MTNLIYFCIIWREYKVNSKWDNIATFSLQKVEPRMDSKWIRYYEIIEQIQEL